MGPKLRSRAKAAEESLSKTCRQQLNSMSNNWITFLNEELKHDLNKKFDDLIECRIENMALVSDINDYHKNRVNEITSKVGINCDNIEENERNLRQTRNKVNNDLNSLTDVLTKRKAVKSKLQKRLKKLNKDLDSLKNENKVLEDKRIAAEEYKRLSDIMKVNYRLTNNKKSILFDFKDRKRNQKMISSESEHISQEFWAFVYKKYGFE
jgi:septal ring factor EnvC (AmiA/AmiB activator)